MIVRNEKETDHRHVEELIRKAFYNLYVPGCTEHYSGAGPGAGTGRPGDRQHSVHKGETFRRGGEGKRDPHVRPCLHRAGISADGLWQAAYGNVF